MMNENETKTEDDSQKLDEIIYLLQDLKELLNLIYQKL